MSLVVPLRSSSFRLSLFWHCCKNPALSLSLKFFSSNPNPPLDLDPSLQALLKDVDISLSRGKTRPPLPRRELEAFPIEGLENTAIQIDEGLSDHAKRKSPAAHFGSQQIGAVILPPQLQTSINLLISESDRVQLHSDAKRLFYDDDLGTGAENEWEAHYESRYRSRRQASRHAERDGTAFASIALPAHYSAIFSVFDHLKRRLGPTWKIERVINWGAATGSGLWASLYSFQHSIPAEANSAEHRLNSTITTYLGIDKREGLVTVGKRLLRNVDLNSLSVSWQRSFRDEDKIPRSDGQDTIALSAFMLTSLPTPLARKALVKEMWESGAHVMVLIDHNTTAGFEAIAQARQYLLDMGRKEFEDPETDELPIRGSHVVAPCPHDGACPLHHPGSILVCGFAQRWQRPSFVRLTKHSGVGHEDIEYSYVVIRRGARPSPPTTNYGRIGDVGKRALAQEALLKVPLRELQLHHESEEAAAAAGEIPASEIETSIEEPLEPQARAELEEALRLEAYSWPRLVFPPLKKGGHVILDGCTTEGKIMRLTIPRSQGKQPYYDARKSGWGDIFPHPPKNPPQERHQPSRAKRDGGTTPTIGADIGKRSNSDRKKDRASYDSLSKAIKEKRKKSRRDQVVDIRE
ncbi:hypothetical protein L208DRAFT_1231139 [Tricholoma matsutake]|nr:hypothetical protein L208DRAFT_1231139 [Tricholoma matsutake 945]